MIKKSRLILELEEAVTEAFGRHIKKHDGCNCGYGGGDDGVMRSAIERGLKAYEAEQEEIRARDEANMKRGYCAAGSAD